MFLGNVMAGRKRKLLALAAGAAPEKAANKNKHGVFDLMESPAELKKPADCESHYFTKKDRLGEDFFQQPCLSLSKAFLGKVMLPSHVNNVTSIHPLAWCQIILQRGNDIYAVFRVNN